MLVMRSFPIASALEDEQAEGVDDTAEELNATGGAA
jgi:hypothetical protein